MTTVFGASNWDDLRFETANTASLFSSTYSFVFLEGGQDNDIALNSFFSSNQSSIETWVFDGGSLFINSAPWNTGMSFGFGGVALTYGPSYSSTGTAVDPNHPIFQGPHGATGANFSANYFAHATVSGGGITPLITGTAGTVLAEKSWGAGHVLFGGMTPNFFHSPSAEAAALSANIIAYGAEMSGSGSTSAIPEPGSMLALGLLMGGGAFMRSRRRTPQAG